MVVRVQGLWVSQFLLGVLNFDKSGDKGASQLACPEARSLGQETEVQFRTKCSSCQCLVSTQPSFLKQVAQNMY